MDDAQVIRAAVAMRRPATFASRLFGAAAGSAAGVAALAAASGARPTLGPDTTAAWAGAALLGAAAGTLLAPDAGAGAPVRATETLDADTPEHSLPEIPTAMLHVVSGGTRRAILAAVVELSARFLARGERVLVVDAGRRLDAHAWIDGDARLGLVECLEGSLPLLGMVQSSGHRGLYLLAHGAPTREERWSRLGRLLDETWPHFGRVFLVVDPGASGGFGDALRGRLLRAWWAGDTDALPKIALALSQRIGIWFGRIDLGARPNATLEALPDRVQAIRALLPLVPVECSELTVAEPLVVAPEPRPRPEVLACNLQVRERLRFLIWMRRVQAESRHAELVPA